MRDKNKGGGWVGRAEEMAAKHKTSTRRKTERHVEERGG